MKLLNLIIITKLIAQSNIFTVTLFDEHILPPGKILKGCTRRLLLILAVGSV